MAKSEVINEFENGINEWEKVDEKFGIAIY
jgi:hypothetical protein